ncbi:hypothetical protein DFS34DRAFT_688887 [Phlyctochytrium arcticum]|nr:hypothetical protein DFS34DRAFT_688887 [Phlyctochytrium arcticum]
MKAHDYSNMGFHRVVLQLASIYAGGLDGLRGAGDDGGTVHCASWYVIMMTRPDGLGAFCRATAISRFQIPGISSFSTYATRTMASSALPDVPISKGQAPSLGVPLPSPVAPVIDPTLAVPKSTRQDPETDLSPPRSSSSPLPTDPTPQPSSNLPTVKPTSEPTSPPPPLPSQSQQPSEPPAPSPQPPRPSEQPQPQPSKEPEPQPSKEPEPQPSQEPKPEPEPTVAPPKPTAPPIPSPTNDTPSVPNNPPNQGGGGAETPSQGNGVTPTPVIGGGTVTPLPPPKNVVETSMRITPTVVTLPPVSDGINPASARVSTFYKTEYVTKTLSPTASTDPQADVGTGGVSSSGSRAAVIVGGILAGIVLLVSVLMGGFAFRREKRRRRQAKRESLDSALRFDFGPPANTAPPAHRSKFYLPSMSEIFPFALAKRIFHRSSHSNSPSNGPISRSGPVFVQEDQHPMVQSHRYHDSLHIPLATTNDLPSASSFSSSSPLASDTTPGALNGVLVPGEGYDAPSALKRTSMTEPSQLPEYKRFSLRPTSWNVSSAGLANHQFGSHTEMNVDRSPQ